jgi:hypothetical protein
MEDTFTSRIDGVDKKRSDYGPTINEADGQIVGQGSMPNLFRISEEVERAKKIKFAKIATRRHGTWTTTSWTRWQKGSSPQTSAISISTYSKANQATEKQHGRHTTG